MSYDVNRLRELRDSIDTYLEAESQREMMIGSEVDRRVKSAIKDEIKPLLDEFKQYLTDQLEKKD